MKGITKTRVAIAAVGLAAASSGAGAFVLPAVASASSSVHTLTFTAVQQKSVNFSATTSANADNDLNSAGKIVGFDVLYIVFNPKTETALGHVTLDTAGGLLYGTVAFNSGPTGHGTVTGGTESFTGATGTITARNLNKSGSRAAVTITYTR
jgi:hypothetical protein